MSHPTLELIEIAKWFRSNWTLRRVRAVDGLSVAVGEGEVFGLIGHNGAGKTTTFKMLVGLLRPTRGTLLWNGTPFDWHRRPMAIGFCPEQPYFYDYLTVRETFDLYGQLYGLSTSERRCRINQLVAEMRLGRKMDARMRTLSKGTLQRVAVAQAILHNPQLAILDEPMSGLDPAGRKDMRDLIRSLKRNGTTVLFSSHILSDAEALCDRVGILAAGRLREVVDVNDNSAAPISYTIVVARVPCRALEALDHIALEPPSGGPWRWRVKVKDQAAVKAALAELHGTDADVESVVPERPSLEQNFLRYADRNDAD